MPTGYTAGIPTGKVTTFREYAMGCARAFGVLIHMRDDPRDAPIPDEIKPDNYHRGELEAYTAELASLKAMTDDEAEQKAQEEYAKDTKRHADRQTERELHRQRYNAMLAKAKRFKAPTPEYNKFAEFIVSQIEESMNWDCDDSYTSPAPKQQTGAEWKQAQIESAEESIAYHQKHYTEECERAAQNTKFLKQLREAIEAVEAEEQFTLPPLLLAAIGRYYAHRRESRESSAAGVPPVQAWDKDADVAAIVDAAERHGIPFEGSCGTFSFAAPDGSLYRVNEDSYPHMKPAEQTIMEEVLQARGTRGQA